jgi:hypothetical protein
VESRSEAAESAATEVVANIVELCAVVLPPRSLPSAADGEREACQRMIDVVDGEVDRAGVVAGAQAPPGGSPPSMRS